MNLRERAHRAIPAGCHTYSKGDDQFPSNAPAFIESGRGCIVRDPDGREFLDWGMGLRSVILGHAYPRVVEAVAAEVARGSNFTRPSPIETYLAEKLIEEIPCAEMVKLAKNGSDVTTAAVRLARAATGRDLVAFPREHPFHSFDDWFIGTTVIDAGVPAAIKGLSLTFTYGQLDDLRVLFEAHPDQVAAVVMEPATTAAPPDGYLEGVRALTEKHGAILVFDEMITGFRWHRGGAQAFYDVTPDLAAFGKGLGNGFSVSALVGKSEIMRLGGFEHDRERVFLLSATNGGETHSIAAALATMDEVRDRDVVGHLWAIGSQLQDGFQSVVEDLGLEDTVSCSGYPCSPVLTFDCGTDVLRASELRTLFMQEMVSAGILIPYIAPSFSHTEADVERTVAAAGEAMRSIQAVVGGEPIERYLKGSPVKPVFRRFNAVELDA